jgi:GntR family transcriptional regulator
LSVNLLFAYESKRLFSKRANVVTAQELPAYRPLYQQVKEMLLGRLIDGTWQPGVALPSEMQLAQELSVSQGTVRKALDALTAEHILVRAQGKGTFVAEIEGGKNPFRFFRFTPDDGSQQFPESTVRSLRLGKAGKAAREFLGLPADGNVWIIERIRRLGGRPVIDETITLPAMRFPDLDQHAPIPSNVDAFYSSHFGLTISRVTERLKAIMASKKTAAALGCTTGTPLLRIDRIAHSLDGCPIEWRSSNCLTDEFHYHSKL